jgi:hypothetical protein
MKSTLIWRAVVLSWIAQLIGIGGMVVTHRGDLPAQQQPK